MRTFVAGFLQNHLFQVRGRNKHFFTKSWNQTKCILWPSPVETACLEQVREYSEYSLAKPRNIFCYTTQYQQKRTVESSSYTSMPVEQESREWNRVVTVEQGSKNNEAHMMTFNISVLDTFPDDVDQKRGTVVALHGFPGTGNDFESLAAKLHERGIRLVAPTSLEFVHRWEILPQERDYNMIFSLGKKIGALMKQSLHQEGMTSSPITMDQLSKIDFSIEGRTNTLQLILDAMNVHRIDVLLGHSAGAWAMYKIGASWENVRCLFGINPGGDRPNRTMRPFLLVRILAALLRWSVGRFIIMPFMAYGYRLLGFKGITTDGDGMNLIASQQYIANQRFADVPLNAKLITSRRLPVLFAYALNDKIVEHTISSNMAYKVLGIPLENTVVYADDKTPSRDPFFVPEGWLTRCLIFARGGHIVHLAHEKEIAEQIEDILIYINNA